MIKAGSRQVKTTQAQALIKAAEVVETVLGGGVVHVMGAREDRPVYGLGEAVCEPGAEYARGTIVYHPASKQLDGVWVCFACGEGPDPSQKLMQ